MNNQSKEYAYFYNNNSLYIQFHVPKCSYIKEMGSFTIRYDDVTNYIVGIHIDNVEEFDWRLMRGHFKREQYLYAIDCVIQTRKSLAWPLRA